MRTLENKLPVGSPVSIEELRFLAAQFVKNIKRTKDDVKVKSN